MFWFIYITKKFKVKKLCCGTYRKSKYPKISYIFKKH